MLAPLWKDQRQEGKGRSSWPFVLGDEERGRMRVPLSVRRNISRLLRVEPMVSTGRLATDS